MSAAASAATDKSASKSARRRLLRRLLRLAGGVLLVLVLLPLVLTPAYRLIHPISTLMVAGWVTGTVDRRWVPLEEIAPVLVHSVLMAEDGRYCSHHGVDWEAVAEVAEDDNPRGASTVTMQTVKNLFLWPSRSYVRKALEVPLAYYADFVLGKRRVVEIYLNIAEWGPGIFGAEAAAQHYFGRPAARLTARQAALMAAALPNPAVRDPAHPSDRMRRIARIIEARAAAAGDYVGCLGL